MTGSRPSGRAAKTPKAMRANPRDWRIEDLERVAVACAINLRKRGGSHVYVTHPAVAEGVSVPAHGRSSRCRYAPSCAWSIA